MKAVQLTFFLLVSVTSLAQPLYDCKLWGLAASGGPANGGTVFSYDINTDTFVREATFSSVPFGFDPMGSLLPASDGLFYGVAWGGGTGNWSMGANSCNGCGTLVSFDPATDSLKKLYDFDYDSGPGGLPYGGPIQASNGKLYGMTNTDINNGGGAIYEYDIQSHTMNTKRDFAPAGGYAPEGSLFQASNGLLYGMTIMGGANNLGVIFSFDINGGTYTSLVDFDGSNGAKPQGDLIQGSDGLLYGMTSNGGQFSSGVLFSFNISTNLYSKLYDLNSTAGGYWPQGSLLLADNGKLYGLCSKGGIYHYGTLFEFDLATGMLADKFHFSYANGKIPLGSLMQASNGKLYGVTSVGGAGSMGVLFEYDILTATFSKKADFSNVVGGLPRYIRLTERCTVVPETLNITGPNIFTPNGDGINDTWMPIVQASNLLKQLQFAIYNRWGAKVFEGDKNDGWNGTSLGHLCPDGTYYYLLQYTDYNNKTHSAKGFLSLTR